MLVVGGFVLVITRRCGHGRRCGFRLQRAQFLRHLRRVADEPVFELETENATTEVAAPVSGTLHIAVAEGKTVRIGAVVGSMDNQWDDREREREQHESRRTGHGTPPALQIVMRY